jgi:hypothetical protein
MELHFVVPFGVASIPSVENPQIIPRVGDKVVVEIERYVGKGSRYIPGKATVTEVEFNYLAETITVFLE